MAVSKVTYGGKTLIDLTGDTVTAAKLLSGTTAHDKKGAKITGTIPSQGAQTITPGTANKTIAAGKYLSGAQTIKGDQNLKAENIAEGVSIFGVTGTLKAGGEIKTASGSTVITASGGYGHIIVSGLDFTPCAVYASIYNTNAYKANVNTGAILFDANGNVVATDSYLDSPTVAVTNSKSYDGGFDWCYISSGGVGNRMYWYAVGV